MGKILNHGNRKKEVGITLLETLISLSIVIVVSVAVVSITIFSANAISKSRIKNFFINETSSFSNLYLFYEEADFISAINATTNKEETSTYHDFTIYYSSSFSYVTQSESNYYINFDFSDGNNTLTLNAYDKGDTLLYTRSVSR